ncbi:hypothetical protein VNO77_41657 [Canavalia gladiata]|uniref:Uncharacterized protein n=1 Tax=Canavalia gladiata TaxID=3824 RepID=A0AAN9JYW9_CANGL
MPPKPSHIYLPKVQGKPSSHVIFGPSHEGLDAIPNLANISFKCFLRKGEKETLANEAQLFHGRQRPIEAELRRGDQVIGNDLLLHAGLESTEWILASSLQQNLLPESDVHQATTIQSSIPPRISNKGRNTREKFIKREQSKGIAYPRKKDSFLACEPLWGLEIKNLRLLGTLTPPSPGFVRCINRS